MTHMSYLVTAISGNVATGILRSIIGYDYNVYGCDVGEYPAGMDLVKDWFRVPYAIDKQYTSELIEQCKKHEIQAIIPANESELIVIDQHRKEFEDAGILLVMNHSYIIQTCLDKYKCMKELAAIGVPVPQTFMPNDLPDGEGDYIIKPCFGCGSKFLKRVGCAAHAKDEERHFGNPLVAQEYLPDDDGEFTMGVFSDGKETRCIVFKRKLTHGYSAFVELIQDERMDAIAHTVAREWSLNGSINLQMRIKNGIPHVFEINPRLSGTTHFRSLLGFNDAMWWCETAAGNPLPNYVPMYHSAIGIRETTEKFVMKRP